VLLFLAGGRQHNGRQQFEAIVLLHLGKDVESAQVGHHEVEQHQSDISFPTQDLQRLTPVVGECYAEGALLELHLDDAADVRLVIRDEGMDQRRFVVH
jgi:hypothetical protein